MFGAIIGDIIGSPYEGDIWTKTKDFPLFVARSVFTDDTVMTIAVADALLEATADTPEEEILQRLTAMLRWHGRRFPNAGYGEKFRRWLKSPCPKPYGSFGNGSAMRVASAGWLFDDLDTVRKMAALSAKVTHDHPEGIKGAEAVASVIFLARTGSSREAIRAYVEQHFHYDLSRTCDEIRPNYGFQVSCQKTVPEAITVFLESKSLEDAIRTAVSLGGDTDTMAAIAGSMAEAYYGISPEWKQEVYNRLPDTLAVTLRRFEEAIQDNNN